MLIWEWRCSWSSADRRCSYYIRVINNFIVNSVVSYIRGLKVHHELCLTKVTWKGVPSALVSIPIAVTTRCAWWGTVKAGGLDVTWLWIMVNDGVMMLQDTVYSWDISAVVLYIAAMILGLSLHPSGLLHLYWQHRNTVNLFLNYTWRKRLNRTTTKPQHYAIYSESYT